MGSRLHPVATAQDISSTGHEDGAATPTVALSYGLGADSTAILLRWLAEPGTAPCDLDELIIVTAMTGDEWTITGRLVETHILSRLAARRIRYAQVARAGHAKPTA